MAGPTSVAQQSTASLYRTPHCTAVAGRPARPKFFSLLNTPIVLFRSHLECQTLPHASPVSPPVSLPLSTVFPGSRPCVLGDSVASCPTLTLSATPTSNSFRLPSVGHRLPEPTLLPVCLIISQAAMSRDGLARFVVGCRAGASTCWPALASVNPI